MSDAALRYQRSEHFRLLYKNGLRLFRIGKAGQVVAIVSIDRKARTARCHRGKRKADRTIAWYRLTPLM